MKLLRFRFRNHLSFKDDAELSMVRSTLKGNKPKDDQWLEHLNRVAAIYGPNASGKSNALWALDYMQERLRQPAVAKERNVLRTRAPFTLDSESKNAASSYIIDFLFNNVRYEYGFEIGPHGIEREWLNDYLNGRARLHFSRTAGTPIELTAGRSLQGGLSFLAGNLHAWDLVLSKMAVFKPGLIQDLHAAIVDDIAVYFTNDSSKQQRMDQLLRALKDDTWSIEALEPILKVADLGITKASVDESELSEGELKRLNLLNNAMNSHNATSNDTNEDETDIEEIEIKSLVLQHLQFHHLGLDNQTYTLPRARQSLGTISWLTLAVASVDALRNGTVLVVDEIETNLHPELTELIIGLFHDETLNTTGAQLIFTTHATNFIAASSDLNLRQDEIWFTEKSDHGTSELYSLEEFTVRKGSDIAKRYRAGAFGAIPVTVRSTFYDLVNLAK